MTQKLDSNQKHMIKLIAKGQQCPSGWAEVGKMIYPLMQKIMPIELVEHHAAEDGKGQARLTKEGQNLLSAMEWL